MMGENIMARHKAIHEVFAITACAVFMLAASEAAVAQPLVWTDPPRASAH